MTLENTSRQRVSDAMDGELSPEQLDAVLAAMHDDESRASWSVYHQIGDALRSDELSVRLSEDFAARMSARLAAEPAILAPATHGERPRQMRVRRLILPGALAAAAATVAFIATPQLMMAMKGDTEAARIAATPVAAEVSRTATVASSGRSETAMRSQDIDEYLIAHQRFSPSVYSSTQYARPAAFSSGATNK
ncbi:sigma-E factor negative regulatory protein [Noviherbaspirillum pedocola]|uniref:Sigma-E factor negative regulatory protein n=1 Tax=Noviherbaspirillum pedocola TaxID=2801341 RepID=A0A934SS45_9BURK|nr:sigma-E factor negative regulatory protein [Noviherbaspirillum pedocola]MBK4734253.1 sigma-E factor negative regulatory protein [Noviherbaspirillum pedocola]